MKTNTRILGSALLGLGVGILMLCGIWIIGSWVGGIRKDEPKQIHNQPEMVNVSPDPCPFIGVDCQPPDASMCVDVQANKPLLSMPRAPGYATRLE